MQNFFSSILYPFEWLLQIILQGFYDLTSLFGFGSYGVAIILLTILIKLLLYPTAKKQIRSMKAMQEMSPKLKAVQEKYKDQPELLKQKVGELYQDAGVNPLAGCLPLLIQMPILMALYYSLWNFQYPTPEAAAFLWLPSMSDADPTHIMPVLAGVFTFLQSYQVTDKSQPAAKYMLYGMPVFITFIGWNFASGLVLYWAVMSICQIVQQWWLYRKDDMKQEAVSKQIAENLAAAEKARQKKEEAKKADKAARRKAREEREAKRRAQEEEKKNESK